MFLWTPPPLLPRRPPPSSFLACLLLGMLLVPPAQAVLDGVKRGDRVFILDIPRGVGRARDVESVEIERGKTIMLNTAFPVSRVAVGDPKIADFVAISEREIEILARGVGDTNLLMWGEGRLQTVMDVQVTSLQPQVVRELTRLLNSPDITVDVAGGSIILRGYVPTLDAHEQAGKVAEAYVQRARTILQDPQDGNRGSSNPYRDQPKVINLLKVGGDHQVMIEVVIAELGREISRALGVNLAGKGQNATQAGTFQSLLKNLSTNSDVAVSPGSPFGTSDIADTVTLAGSFFSSGSTDVRIFLEAVEASKLGTILAEPTVVARSGQKADFLVGGEVPVPVPSVAAGTLPSIAVFFKKFGVNVTFTPTVLESDRIHMDVLSEVSEPDFLAGVPVGDAVVPSFRTRRVTTGVELGNGETFVLAGLLREDIFAEYENMPFLADVPILGQLFRTRSLQKTQSELVLIATPHLVQPLAPGTELPLPTDHYIEPTLFEFYWEGRIEGRAPLDKESPVTAASPTREEAPPLDLSENLAATAAGAAPATPIDDQVGGLLGSFGHRLSAPTPTGEIQ